MTAQIPDIIIPLDSIPGMQAHFVTQCCKKDKWNAGGTNCPFYVLTDKTCRLGDVKTKKGTIPSNCPLQRTSILICMHPLFKKK